MSAFTISRDPDELAAPFVQLDRGDDSGLRELDIMYDSPGVITVARMHFAEGVGYEVIYSTEADPDDFNLIARMVGRYRLLRVESWGMDENGTCQKRALYWHE